MRICWRTPAPIEHHNEEELVRSMWQNMGRGVRWLVVAAVAVVLLAAVMLMWPSDDTPRTAVPFATSSPTQPAAEVIIPEPSVTEEPEPTPTPSVDDEQGQPYQRFKDPRMLELYEQREADPNFFCGGANLGKHPYAKNACPNAFATITLTPNNGAEINQVVGGKACDKSNIGESCTLTYSQAKRVGDTWKLELELVDPSKQKQFGVGLWVRSARPDQNLNDLPFVPSEMHRIDYGASRIWHILVVWHDASGGFDTAEPPYNIRSWNKLCGTVEPCGKTDIK